MKNVQALNNQTLTQLPQLMEMLNILNGPISENILTSLKQRSGQMVDFSLQTNALVVILERILKLSGT